jgi:hypothetical protein
LQVRVGIATGLVVVGDLIGEGAAREEAVVGETPNLASRLQALAEPGTVVIAASTRRLTGGLFDYEDLGAVKIKGLAAPVIASRVRGESGAESRFEALRATRTPLVGRDEEMALLRRRWQQATRGEGCVVLVSGEPGIGKSRLAHTLAEGPSGEPHTRLRFFCSPYHRDHALYPTIDQLERAAGFRREDTTDARLDKLEAVLARATDDVGEAAPLLAALLSLPAGERYPPLNLTPQKQKETTLRALVAQVEGLAARQPVLMVFEDAHWSDPTSVELLDLFILLIVTFRPEFTPPWTGRPHVSLLALNRLAPRQGAEMIAGITGGRALPEDIAAQIIERTDGVPLFVEELTKAVIESGMVTDLGDRYAAVRPLVPLAIPASLQASLLARLDRLAPAREVAQIGAALGRQFSHELIAAVAAMPATELDDALVGLVGAELIYRRGTPPDAEYTFKHALVQDAAYSTLLRSRRRQLHGRIAATLEDRFPDTVAAQPALLARHCEEAGLTEKAVEYWLAAGRHALGRSAATEAAALLRRGRALVPALPEGEWRQERELDLQIALGRALIANRGWGAPGLDEVHSRARELALSLNRPRALLFALWGQITEHWARADLKRARRLAAELHELGEAAGDVLTQVLGCDAVGATHLWLGEFTAGRPYLEKALAVYDPAHAPSYSELLSYDARVQLRLQSSFLLACLGHLDQALFQRDAALDEADRLSHSSTVAHALACAWWIAWFLGLPPGSLLPYADQTLALAGTHRLLFFRAMALLWRGWCLAALGRTGEGMPLVTAGLADWGELGLINWRPLALTVLGDACRMAGQSRRPSAAHPQCHRQTGAQVRCRCDCGERRSCNRDVREDCGAPAADGDVLRSRRVNRAFGAARPGGSARGDRLLSPLRCRGHRARRRVCRQVHGRRGARLLRLSARRRARCRARGAGRAGAGRGDGRGRDRGQGGIAGAGGDRHRARGGGRPDRRGSGAGAGGGRRDAEPCVAAASAGETRHGGDRCEHAATDRRSVRLRGYPNILQQLIIDLGEQVSVDVVGFEGVGILAETDCLQPIPRRPHAASSPSSAFASCRTGVAKPSVNQPYTGARRSRASPRLPWSRHSRARPMTARSSQSFALCRCAIAIASA